MGAVLTAEGPFIDACECGLMITSPPLNVKAEFLECSSVSGSTMSELTTMGKRTKRSSWTYVEVTAKSRNVCDLVCISARNLVTV